MKEHYPFNELAFDDAVSIVMQLFDTPSVYFTLPSLYGEHAGEIHFYRRSDIFPVRYSNLHTYLDMVVSNLEKEPSSVIADMATDVYKVAKELRRREAIEIVTLYIEEGYVDGH